MTRTKTSATSKNTALPSKKRRVSLTNPLSPGAKLLPMKSAGSQLGLQESASPLSYSAKSRMSSELSQREQLLQPNAEGMVSISFKDLRKIGDPNFDWTTFDALTDEDIAKAVADDPDAAPVDMDWSDAVVLELMPKTPISLRVDTDVYDYFKSTGKGFQTRMNAVLRAYVAHQRGRKQGR
jgi:uncharacterized protein (DUF4415 family)